MRQALRNLTQHSKVAELISCENNTLPQPHFAVINLKNRAAFSGCFLIQHYLIRGRQIRLTLLGRSEHRRVQNAKFLMFAQLLPIGFSRYHSTETSVHQRWRNRNKAEPRF